MLHEKIQIPVDPLKLQCVLKDASHLVRQLDQQIEARRRAPDGSEKQRQIQLRIDEIEMDIAFFANNDLNISGAALAALARAEHMPQLKRSIVINAEALAKAEARLDVAQAEMKIAERAYQAAVHQGKLARKELRDATAEHILIARGCESL